MASLNNQSIQHTGNSTQPWWQDQKQLGASTEPAQDSRIEPNMYDFLNSYDAAVDAYIAALADSREMMAQPKKTQNNFRSQRRRASVMTIISTVAAASSLFGVGLHHSLTKTTLPKPTSNITAPSKFLQDNAADDYAH